MLTLAYSAATRSSCRNVYLVLCLWYLLQKNSTLLNVIFFPGFSSHIINAPYSHQIIHYLQASDIPWYQEWRGSCLKLSAAVISQTGSHNSWTQIFINPSSLQAWCLPTNKPVMLTWFSHLQGFLSWYLLAVFYFSVLLALFHFQFFLV